MTNSREGLARVRDALTAHGVTMVSKPDGSWRGRCPQHGGMSTDSLSLRWVEPKVGERCGRAQLRCFGSCDERDVLSSVGLGLVDLYDTPPPKIGGKVTREHVYIGATGQMLGVVRRTEPKSFRPATPSSSGWLAKSSDDLKKTPYRLRGVLSAIEGGQPVYITEGEHDADVLAALGIAATCNAGGAGKWTAEHAYWLKGADVTICRDRDEPGHRHSEQVAVSLDGIAASVRVVEAAEGKDVAEHLALGHSLDELVPVETSVPAFPDTGVGEQGTPLYADVSALLDGGLPDPPAPAFLTRTDGCAIFYAGQVNALFGDPESGKTLVALAAAAEALIAGLKVAVIDIDHNGPEAIVCRLLDMDVPEETLRDLGRFRYTEPEDRAHLYDVVADLALWRPTVAVVDSVGELLPLMGLSSNSPDDFTMAHTRVLKALAMVGAAVIAIDHLAKNTESRAQGSTGTAAKRRAIGGVSIRVTIDEQFTPGKGGSCFLTIHKDRHGGLRKRCLVTPGRESVAGIFKIAPLSERISWTLEAPKDGDVPKPDRIEQADLDALSHLQPPPHSVRDVKDRLRWRSDRAARVLREWRSLGSLSVPREQGTEDDDGDDDPVPRSLTPVSGNGERRYPLCTTCHEREVYRSETTVCGACDPTGTAQSA